MIQKYLHSYLFKFLHSHTKTTDQMWLKFETDGKLEKSTDSWWKPEILAGESAGNN